MTVHRSTPCQGQTLQLTHLTITIYFSQHTLPRLHTPFNITRNGNIFEVTHLTTATQTDKPISPLVHTPINTLCLSHTLQSRHIATAPAIGTLHKRVVQDTIMIVGMLVAITFLIKKIDQNKGQSYIAGKKKKENHK